MSSIVSTEETLSCDLCNKEIQYVSEKHYMMGSIAPDGEARFIYFHIKCFRDVAGKEYKSKIDKAENVNYGDYALI